MKATGIVRRIDDLGRVVADNFDRVGKVLLRDAGPGEADGAGRYIAGIRRGRGAGFIFLKQIPNSTDTIKRHNGANK